MRLYSYLTRVSLVFTATLIFLSNPPVTHATTSYDPQLNLRLEQSSPTSLDIAFSDFPLSDSTFNKYFVSIRRVSDNFKPLSLSLASSTKYTWTVPTSLGDGIYIVRIQATIGQNTLYDQESFSVSSGELTLIQEPPLRFRNYGYFSDYIETPDQIYTSVDGTNLMLDVFEPSGDTMQKRPFVLIIHGGGFVGGSRKDPQFRSLAINFARRGYVAVSVDYRLVERAIIYPNGHFDIGKVTPAMIVANSNDINQALTWMINHSTQFRLAPSRFAILGSSAGGIIALSTAYSKLPRPLMVVSIAGTMPHRETYPISTKLPYTILIHGTADTTIPYSLTLDFHNYLASKNIYHQLVSLDGLAHEPGPATTSNINLITNSLYERVPN